MAATAARLRPRNPPPQFQIEGFHRRRATPMKTRAGRGTGQNHLEVTRAAFGRVKVRTWAGGEAIRPEVKT
jgi:hypothetical protein